MTLDDETVSAYHEAGHAVIACALGARIDRVSLSQASAFDDDESGLPARFGDCLVNWGRVDPDATWQQQKELLTTLAGPVAEWTYLDRDMDHVDPQTWALDFEVAQRCAARLASNGAAQSRLIRSAIKRLQTIIASDVCWAAIAAIADELMIGDEVDGDRVAEIVEFWWRRR